MSYSLGEAAKATGRSKATIHRAIQSHKISATKDAATGAWMIEAAELHRVFQPVSSKPPQNSAMRQSEIAGETGETVELRRRLEELREERERERADKDAVIDDLRHRLDASDEERRKVQAQLTALLTDQREKTEPPARRSRWPWGRR